MRILDLLKRLIGWSEFDGVLQIGTRVGFSSVVEIGPTELETDSVTPVKLSDGSYAILSVRSSSSSRSGKAIDRWVSDNIKAELAIRRSVKMPKLSQLSPNAFAVRGEDSEGWFGAILYFNYRKVECGWTDEFQRSEDKVAR